MDHEGLGISVKEEPPEEFVLVLPPASTGNSRAAQHEEDVKPLMFVDVKEESLEDFMSELAPPPPSDQSHKTRYPKRKKRSIDGRSSPTKFNDGPVKHSLRERRLHKCVNCNALFPNNLLLDGHRSKCHGNMFECDRCPYQTKVKTDLTMHRKTHDKTYCCFICQKKFKLNFQQTQQRPRIYATGSDEIFSCGKCEEIFKNKTDLLPHSSNKKIYKCVACGVGIPEDVSKCSKCSFQTKIHQSLSEQEGRKLFYCETCLKKFPTALDLKAHQIQYEHGAFARGPRGTFDCSDCDKSFSFLDYLSRHQRKAHNEHKFECGVCGKAFKSKDTLRNHLQTHITAECSVCRIKISKRYWADHSRSHSIENRFKDVICY